MQSEGAMLDHWSAGEATSVLVWTAQGRKGEYTYSTSKHTLGIFVMPVKGWWASRTIKSDMEIGAIFTYQGEKQGAYEWVMVTPRTTHDIEWVE
jgi:hypothetical protein